MRSRIKAAVAGAACLAGAAGFVLAAGTAAQAATTPPWEPDASAVGTITFYDASGAVITSGSTSTAPFYAYAVGSAQVRAGDTQAAIELATPRPSTDPALYFRDQVSSATAYPLSSGPANIQALSQNDPVNTGSPGDLSIDTYLGESVAQTDPSYANIYQVRLITTDTHTNTLNYDDADILVDPAAHTWTQVYPAPATVPGAPSGVSAVAHNGSATVSWTAPSDNGGSAVTGYAVQYSSDGGTSWKDASAAFNSSTSTTQTVTGLTNATSYVFRVAAINSVGTGPYSAKSAAVTPVADSSAFTIGRSTTIAYGKKATVTGRLTDTTTHTALGHVRVELFGKTGAAKAFSMVTSLTTSSTGAVSFVVAPHQNTLYHWVFAGTAAHKAATSANAGVRVAQVVTAAVQAGKVKHGVAFKVFGTVSPNEAGKVVVLQQRVGTRFKNTTFKATVRLQKLPNGKKAVGYVITAKEAKAGKYTFRVSRAATPVNAAGVSNPVTKTVV